MNDYKLIHLRGKNGEGMFAKVSLEDYEELSKWNWYLEDKGGYARGVIYTGYPRNRKNIKQVMMHRYILNVSKEEMVDHINGDRLDNRRENLRIASLQENARNRKGKNKYKGVGWHKRQKKWFARIIHNNTEYFLGNYDSDIEAAKAYNYWAEKLHNEFARLNDVDHSDFIPKPVRGINKNTSSKYLGISWQQRDKIWIARITANGKYHYIGSFKNEKEAAKAYNIKAKELLGERAILNEGLDDVEVVLKVKKIPTSKYRGVSKRGKKWIGMIQVNRKSIYLGTFDTQLEAAIAYNKKAIELHGKKAILNDIDKDT